MADARAAPGGAGPEPTAEDLRQRALAAYLEGRYDDAATAGGEAFRALRRDGDTLGAVRTARLLAWLHGNVRGDWAVGQGWLGQALTALRDAQADDDGEAVRGWRAFLEAEVEPDPVRRVAGYRTALGAARRAEDRDLECESLGWLGLLRVFDGEVGPGMRLLDETLAGVCAGDVEDVVVIEGTFCGMLWACETVQDVGRAEQWVRALQELCRRRELPVMSSFCRAHYGALLTVAGRWREAEAELVRAAEQARPVGPRIHHNALVRLALLRVRQGRLEEAAQLLAGLDRYPDAALPLAALHHALGRSALARAVLDRGLGPHLEATTDAALLALTTEVCLAEGDLAAADGAAARLEQLAAASPESHLDACAALARGLVLAARGDPAAVAALDRAVTGFASHEMPLELARARLELARALAADRPELAVAEAQAALAGFDALGAGPFGDDCAALLRRLGAPPRTGRRGTDPLTRREAEVLELLGHGLSNPEIADRLFLSRKTVEHHVSNVLAKLGLRSRAEAAGWAARNPGAGMGEVPGTPGALGPPR